MRIACKTILTLQLKARINQIVINSSSILSSLRSELLSSADPKTRASGDRFFKEPVTAYGVKTAVVEKMASRYFGEMKQLGKPAIFRLCEDLLRSDYMEEAFIAFEWAYRLRDQYEPADFAIFEGWLKRYVNNWAKCDTLCNHTIGTFVDRYPEYVESLKVWALSPNRWLRRGAAVTLILPARKGNFLKDIFEIADRLLLDKDDLVQKGYGWMLKEASRRHQAEVFDYIVQRKDVMPRTALRYAIEKMPGDLRRQAMARQS